MKIEFTKDQVKTMQTALDKWGLNAQVGQTIEECAELIVVLQKYINRTECPAIDKIVDEIADVEIMLGQMRLALGIDDNLIAERIAQKFERLNQYLKLKE